MELRYPHDYTETEDAAAKWAAHREFSLRWRAYYKHRCEMLGAGFGGVAEAMVRLRKVLTGDA